MSTATVDPNYDYTRDSSTGASPDDFEIADVRTHNKTSDELAAENGFRDVPVGEHVFEIIGLAEAPKEQYYKVMVDGQMAGYQAHSARVKMSLKGDSRAIMSDFFTFPPSADNELKAYYEGTDPEKPNGAKGFAASKFYQFLGAIGYDYPAGGKMPVEARRPSNWKGRQVIATVAAGKGTYTAQSGANAGQEVPRPNQIKLFSYRKAGGVILPTATRGASAAQTSGQPSTQSAAPVQNRRQAIGVGDL